MAGKKKKILRKLGGKRDGAGRPPLFDKQEPRIRKTMPARLGNDFDTWLNEKMVKKDEGM